MSALDLNRLNTTIRRCAATLLDASYTDGIPSETTDVWRTIAADAARDLTALITRLRAAEARTAWTDSLALQAHSMATAIEQGDEDGELDALGPVTAAIIRSDVARMLEIVAERPAPLAARTAWQPIETAPVGVEVLVTRISRQGLRYTSGGILLGAPTHWMPLPTAPEAP